MVNLEDSVHCADEQAITGLPINPLVLYQITREGCSEPFCSITGWQFYPIKEQNPSHGNHYGLKFRFAHPCNLLIGVHCSDRIYENMIHHKLLLFLKIKFFSMSAKFVSNVHFASVHVWGSLAPTSDTHCSWYKFCVKIYLILSATVRILGRLF